MKLYEGEGICKYVFQLDNKDTVFESIYCPVCEIEHVFWERI